MPDRTFYGGDALSGPAGGEISAGHYDGPETRQTAPWKCPACGVENTGRLALGCVHCGRGTPGYHVGTPLPAVPVPAGTVRTVQSTENPAMYALAEVWAEEHSEASLAEAFVAGFLTAVRTIVSAPPVTADIEHLAPAGKAARTIVAALLLFKDQVLSQSPEEVASGEWCSAAEVDQLVADIQDIQQREED